jgi:hypothetical protein
LGKHSSSYGSVWRKRRVAVVTELLLAGLPAGLAAWRCGIIGSERHGMAAD